MAEGNSGLIEGQIMDPDRLFNALSVDICNKYIEVGIQLGLTGIVLINELETGDLKTQQGNRKALRMLQLWRESVGEDKCTYSVLADALEKHGFTRCSLKYCYTSELCTDDGHDTETSLQDYLASYYDKLSQTTTYLNSHIIHPIHDVPHFFEVTMVIKEEQRIGRIHHDQASPISLENIFKRCKRKVVLIEGDPGSGKSTLSLHIATQVNKHKLFDTEFSKAILVQLRNEDVQNAQSLADLLPCGNDMFTQQAAKDIYANNGHRTLFILDGWDELPQKSTKYSKSFLYRQLFTSDANPKNHLLNSAVIVTSRPKASSELRQLVQTRVEITGFAPETLMEYLGECFKKDKKALQYLQERVQVNPLLRNIFSLPLNARILVYLYKDYDSDLHNNIQTITQYDIFSKLVLNIIYKHEKGQDRNETLKSLTRLPSYLQKRFNHLCKLAYEELIKGDTHSKLTEVEDFDLRCGVQNLISAGTEVTYSFAHVSIQEFLAAHHLNTLGCEEQDEIFDELFRKQEVRIRLTMFFRFYAGITKFQTQVIQKSIIELVANCEKSHKSTKDGKILLLHIMHCLYEAQNSELCKHIANQLHYMHGLNLSYIALTPSDCHCIGYFLSCVCTMDIGNFKVNLDCCSIGDIGCRHLAICEFLSGTQASTLLSMSMKHNKIGQEGCNYLSSLLDHKKACKCVVNLKLNCNPLGPSLNDIYTYLKNSTTLTTLCLNECGLTSSTHYNGFMRLTLSLKSNKHLQMLSLQCNALCDNGIKDLAKALEFNQTLKELNLCNCGMTDTGLNHLAASLQVNNSITELRLHNIEFAKAFPNSLTVKSVSNLTSCLLKNRTLTLLLLPRVSESNYEDTICRLKHTVNENRKQSGQQHEVINISVDGVTADEAKEYEESFENAFKFSL